MSERLAQDYSPDANKRRTEQARAEIRSRQADAASASLLVIAVLGVLYTLYLAQEIVLPFVLAAVLNLLLQPAKRFLTSKLRVPSALASIALILALFCVVAGIAAGISVPASTWVSRAPEALPKLQRKLGALQGPIQYLETGAQQIEHLLGQAGAGQGGAAAAQEPKSPQPVAVSQSPGLSGVGMTVLAGTRAFLGQLFTILFFLLWAGDTLLRSFVEIMPTFGDKRRVVEIGNEIEGNISGYLATITVMNILVGIANGLSTWACCLPDPLLWGTLAFLLNYIPILGPFSGVAIFFAVGLFTYDTIWWALLPAGIYLIIHVIEGETVTPMLVAHRFTLNPVLVILSLFFWDWMWGVMGALLAVPLLAICKVICDHIDVLTPLGHMIGGSPKKRVAAT